MAYPALSAVGAQITNTELPVVVKKWGNVVVIDASGNNADGAAPVASGLPSMKSHLYGLDRGASVWDRLRSDKDSVDGIPLSGGGILAAVARNQVFNDATALWDRERQPITDAQLRAAPIEVNSTSVIDIRPSTDTPVRIRQAVNGTQNILEFYLNHGAGDIIIAYIDTNGNFVPATNNVYELGSALLAWKTVWANDLSAVGNVAFGAALANTFRVRGTLVNTTSFQRVAADFVIPALGANVACNVNLPVVMPDANYLAFVAMSANNVLQWDNAQILVKTTTQVGITVTNLAAAPRTAHVMVWVVHQ